MRRFIETYKDYDIYLETNEEITGNSPHYEIVDKRLKITYTIYGDFYAVKKIIDGMAKYSKWQQAGMKLSEFKEW